MIILFQQDLSFAGLMKEGREIRHTCPKDAVEIFKQAAKSTNCPNCTVSALIEAGITYRQLKIYKDAENSLIEAESVLTPKRSDLMALVRMELGRVFLDANCSKDKAYKYLLDSHSIFVELEYNIYSAISKCLLGQVQHLMKFDPEGRYTIRGSYHMIKGLNDNDELKILLWYMRTSNRAKIKYLPRAIKLAIKTKSNCFRPLTITVLGHKVEKKIFNY